MLNASATEKQKQQQQSHAKKFSNGPAAAAAAVSPTELRSSRDSFVAAAAADPNASPIASSRKSVTRRSAPRTASKRSESHSRDKRDRGRDAEWDDATVAGTGAYSSVSKNNPTVLFNISKKESLTPNSGLKIIQRKLRNGFRIGLNKDDMSINKVGDASLLIFGAPRDKFSMSEFGALKSFLDKGGSILYLAGEGGESEFNTNFNYLLEEYGMIVNPDCVTRTVFYKYFHPKEVFVSNGILNRELNRAAGKKTNTSPSAKAGSEFGNDKSHTGLAFVYPFGASLTVQKPAIPLLSTGTVSYPLNRPIAAAYISNKAKGKIVVVGSGLMFSDAYIEKEENSKIFDVIMQLLTTDKVILNPIDANEPDVSDYHYLPDTPKLAENLRSCLQESEDVPKDFTTLFDIKLFNFGTDLVPSAIKLYEDLRLKHESLSLIQPQVLIP
ncbi:Intraflagellar transport protein 52 [Entophlyctis sp. JEL0112]|nr:Intraflagellar transport protein 52 [Entophlyctis sp. JEL0112]